MAPNLPLAHTKVTLDGDDHTVLPSLTNTPQSTPFTSESQSPKRRSGNSGSTAGSAMPDPRSALTTPTPPGRLGFGMDPTSLEDSDGESDDLRDFAVAGRAWATELQIPKSRTLPPLQMEFQSEASHEGDADLDSRALISARVIARHCQQGPTLGLANLVDAVTKSLPLTAALRSGSRRATGAGHERASLTQGGRSTSRRAICGADGLAPATTPRGGSNALRGATPRGGARRSTLATTAGLSFRDPIGEPNPGTPRAAPPTTPRLAWSTAPADLHAVDLPKRGGHTSGCEGLPQSARTSHRASRGQFPHMDQQALGGALASSPAGAE